MARTARRQLERRHLLSEEYLRAEQPWTCTIGDELNIDGGKHVLAMFLNKELFWMNNKTIIEFGFHILWRIMDISEGINAPWPTASMDNTLLDLHDFSKVTQPHSFIVDFLSRKTGLHFQKCHCSLKISTRMTLKVLFLLLSNQISWKHFVNGKQPTFCKGLWDTLCLVKRIF